LARTTSPEAVLGVLAGIYIAFGGLFATVALASSAGLPYGVGQVIAGLVHGPDFWA
jgi:formate transporter